MMNQNEEHEDILFEEKKKQTDRREAGMGADGEFSAESLKRWFTRAGGALAACAAAVCLMTVLMAGKNQKESLIMEVNSDILMEFTMNRRGAVLSASGKMATNETVSMDAFDGKSLGITVGKIFDRLAENNSLGEDGGILISVRRSDPDSKASPEKIVKEVQKETESELQKKESRATVYVFESEEDTKTREIADKYGITVTKAEFLKRLFAENPEITVSGAPTDELNNKWEYYVNQIHEMDKFVKELTTKLADYPEPVVLVMYGDHLPTMGLKVEDLENRYLYQTEYVIWDNMGLKRKQENIASYQIAAEVMNRVGIHDGTIFRYHQTRRNTKNYQVDLEVLQYDMLYGKRYVYGEDGETPYERVKLQMGALPVTLERIEKSGEDTWYFYGENFTASSRVEVNEEIQDTVYVSPSILMVHSLTLEDGDQITIAQQSNSSTKKVLTRTEPMMYEEPKTVSTPTPTPNPDSTKTDVTQENANTSTAPQDELTAAPSGAPEGEGDKIEPSKTENSDKPAEDGGLQN